MAAEVFPNAEFFDSERFSDVDIVLFDGSEPSSRKRARSEAGDGAAGIAGATPAAPAAASPNGSGSGAGVAAAPDDTVDAVTADNAAVASAAGAAGAAAEAGGPAPAGDAAAETTALVMMPGHRVVLATCKVLAAQLDRWSGEGRPRVTLHLPRATGGASELARVKRVFVECLYRGAAAALAAASPNRIYGVLVMADYYEAPSVQQKAAARLHRAFTEGEDRLWRTVTPSGRGSAASGGGASQEDRALLRAARVALTPASQDQAVVARLRQGAASYLAAVACPGPLISAWQAAGGAARARVLAEPSTLVMSRLLRRDCAAATAAGHLAAAPAFSIAAEWCAAQPGGGGAAQRRALLEALPLGQLSLLFFTSVVMGSQLSSALKKWELQALLLHIQAAPVKVSALHAGWVAPPWAAEGGGRELRLAASARAIRTAAAALAALPAAGAAGKRCHTVVPEDPAAWEVFVGGHRFRLSLLVWQERASSAAPESWLALACKQLRPAFAFDGIAPAARCRLSVSTLEGDEATRLRTAEVAFVAGGAEQEVCCFRDKARDPNDLDYSDFESDGDGYIIWDRYRYRPLFEDDAGELCLSIKFKVVA